MRLTVPRTVTALAALAALAFGLAPAAATAAPTLTLTENCDGYPPISSVGIHLMGLPPNEQFAGKLEFFNDDGSSSGGIEGDFVTDENGSFEQSLGAEIPQTYRATVVWAGGTLETSLRVDCSPPIEPGSDYAARVIVHRSTPATSGGGHHTRGFTVKVTKSGKGPFAVTADDIAAEVLVNGAPSGAVRFVSSRVAKPGKRVKFHYSWRYGGVAPGDEVEYAGCVNAVGDPDDDNDCASHKTTAVAEP